MQKSILDPHFSDVVRFWKSNRAKKIYIPNASKAANSLMRVIFDDESFEIYIADDQTRKTRLLKQEMK